MLIRGYERYCQSVTGGQKAPKEAAKCRRHNSYLLDIANIIHVQQLSDPEYLNAIEQKYIMENPHKHGPNTIANCLRRLNAFCMFLCYNPQLDTGFTDVMHKRYAYR